MKKLLPLMLVAVGALTACAGSGTKVSKEEYAKKAQEVEAHEYSSAVITVKENAVTRTMDDEDFEAQVKAGEKKIKVKATVEEDKYEAKVEYTWDKDEKTWVWQSGEVGYASLLITKAIDAVPPEDYVGNGETFEYYINPFKVVATMNMDETVMGVNVKANATSTYQFDKYGFAVSSESKSTVVTTLTDDYNNSITATLKLQGIEADFSAVKELKSTSNIKVSVSYK